MVVYIQNFTIINKKDDLEKDKVDSIYRKKIKEWKENQLKLNKSNLVPGEGTRARIRKESILEASKLD